MSAGDNTESLPMSPFITSASGANNGGHDRGFGIIRHSSYARRMAKDVESRSWVPGATGHPPSSIRATAPHSVLCSASPRSSGSRHGRHAQELARTPRPRRQASRHRRRAGAIPLTLTPPGPCAWHRQRHPQSVMRPDEMIIAPVPAENSIHADRGCRSQGRATTAHSCS